MGGAAVRLCAPGYQVQPSAIVSISGTSGRHQHQCGTEARADSIAGGSSRRGYPHLTWRRGSSARRPRGSPDRPHPRRAQDHHPHTRVDPLRQIVPAPAPRRTVNASGLTAETGAHRQQRRRPSPGTQREVQPGAQRRTDDRRALDASRRNRPQRSRAGRTDRRACRATVATRVVAGHTNCPAMPASAIPCGRRRAGVKRK
jgi:hypothetical protein